MLKIVLTLGIRPDLIRASRIIKLLEQHPDVDLKFVWSGQHYADNLKDVFIRDLGLPEPDIELEAGGATDAETVSAVISKLHPVLEELAPDVAVFLGDTNTVMGCIAAAQLNIPIVHIEGCMRSYDWRMPEEKYRTVIDHLSDVVYTYFPEYFDQGVAEGLNPRNIVIIENLIVDVLDDFYYAKRDEFEEFASPEFFADRQLEPGDFYLMTWHRRENVEEDLPVTAILELLSHSPRMVYFPASYRTQKRLAAMNVEIPEQVRMVDPIGYREFLALLVNSAGVVTDSGTVVEESAVLGIPSLQMRRSTERPQVYDCRSSVKFDPGSQQDYAAPEELFGKFEALAATEWKHELGDGFASQRLVEDLVARLQGGTIRGHEAADHHLDIARSYIGDGL